MSYVAQEPENKKKTKTKCEKNEMNFMVNANICAARCIAVSNENDWVNSNNNKIIIM